VGVDLFDDRRTPGALRGPDLVFAGDLEKIKTADMVWRSIS